MVTDYCYVYNAVLWCEACGDKLRAELPLPQNCDENDEHTWDSDYYPKGPYRTDESDNPEYCDGCGGFLENALTSNGAEYVREAIASEVAEGRFNSIAVKVWAPFYDIPLPDQIGDVTLVNPGDRDSWTCTHAYVFHFGAYGDTHLMVWGDSLDSALDEAIDWLVDNAPGHIVDDQVQEEYECLCEEYGPLLLTDEVRERLQEESEADTTCGGNYGNRINSWEWSVTEDPSPAELKELFAR
jgi:hypothetical protein